MQALELTRPGSFRVVDVAAPGAPGPGEALLRVHRVGICGTDLAGYLGKMPFFSYPRIPGHELGVEVLAVGEGVTHIRPGDRCAVEPYLNCGRCYACRRGHTNCCEHNRTLGVMCDGGLCERIILPAAKLHPSARLSFEQLALVETLAIGCHAVDRGAPVAGEQILVVGAGPIGLSAIVFARLSGARTLVMDVNAERLAFVRDVMGVPDTLLVTGAEADLAALGEATGGRLADVVIDATGNPASMARALQFCAFRGRLVYVGITASELSFPHAPVLHRRELDVRASRNALPADFRRIIRLIEEGAIDTRPWITHTSDFAGLPAAFPGWTRPENRVIKAMVRVPDPA